MSKLDIGYWTFDIHPERTIATPTRVRFAPSPTGYLHVGGARTALFNWLYARHVGGKFLLRIEDTDKQRSTDEHTQVILDGLTWLGLDWDEELVFQGARVQQHQAAADRLLAEGKAYMDEGAIRFKVPAGEIAWDDAVHERISFQGEDLKDFIVLRTDRTPTYNLAVVVDDVDMAITHVLRGDDHISNTPKQIALYRALGTDPPVFGHVPMINGADGKKLSKRHGATAVGDYQHTGILPAGWPAGISRFYYGAGRGQDVTTLRWRLRKPSTAVPGPGGRCESAGPYGRQVRHAAGGVHGLPVEAFADSGKMQKAGEAEQ